MQSMSEISFEEQLEKGEKLVHINKGNSMLPMLRPHRDLMIIEKRPEARCRKYDLVLYKRPDGVYVIHRILKVRKDDYIICGDHCWKREIGVKEDWILGVLTSFVRDGKEISVKDPRYLLYVHLWSDFFWIRAFILRVKAKVCSLRKKG